jgi:hypothetical protein
MPFSSSVLAKGCALLLSCYLSSVAAQDCVLSVPANPLSAKGLATPYTVTGCNQIDFSNQGSFVEAAIFDPATNQISVYHPLVVNRGAVAGDTADCVNGLGASIFGQVCSWSMPMTRPFLTVGFSLTNANLISLPTAMATSFSKSLRPRSLLGN